MLENLVLLCNHNSVRRRFDEENCSVAQSLEVLGDWWTLLLIREAFFGTRRFGDFQSVLGISKNVLSQRLEHLVEHEVFAKVDAGVHGQRYEYVLTPRGKDLATVLTALRQWGDRWLFGKGKEPLLVVDERTGERLPKVRILGDDGQPLPPTAFGFRLGPGATQETAARFAQLWGGKEDGE